MRNSSRWRSATLPMWALSAFVACGDDGATTSEARTSALEAARAAGSRALLGPELALIATQPGATTSDLHFVRAGLAATTPPIARFSHALDAEVRGALLPGRRVIVAVADVDTRGDGSWGATLFRLEPGRPARAIADRCYHASRPLALADGSVLVQRGHAGAEPTQASHALRTDALTIDAVDPETGATRTLYSSEGYIAHLAGRLEHEVFVYRVAPGHAELLAIDPVTATTRVLAAPIAAFARDFSVDPAARALVYTTRDEQGWMIEQLRIADGTRTVLMRSDGMWATPHVWPGGGLLTSDPRGGVVRGGAGVVRAMGPGFDELRAVSSDQRFVALVHHAPRAFSSAFVYSRDADAVSAAPAPSGARIDVVGFLP